MTTKRLVFECDDGLTILMPNPSNRHQGEDELTFLRRVWARNVEASKSKNGKGQSPFPGLSDETTYAIVDASDLPQDRATRSKWRLVGGEVKVADA